MPSGNTHTEISLGLAVTSFTVSSLFIDLQAGLITFLACLAGDLFLSPDLDGEYSNCKKRWWILGRVWRLYERLPHRHPLSHCPVISDIGRLLYLAVIAASIAAIAGTAAAQSPIKGALAFFSVFDWIQKFVIAYPGQSIAIISGLSINTAGHVIADLVVSEAKKVIDFKPSQARKAVEPKRLRSRRRTPRKKQQNPCKTPLTFCKDYCKMFSWSTMAEKKNRRNQEREIKC